jgi:hypothetical protein
MLLFSLKSFSQNSDESKPVVKWDNGDITLFKDLGKVWINLKSGTTYKNVSIWSIESVKGKLTYNKDGSLHDLMIGKIENIMAGKNSHSVLYFDNENLPRIKNTNAFFFADEKSSDFYISAKGAGLVKENSEQKSLSTYEVKESKKPANNDTLSLPALNPNNFQNSVACDTIIKMNGEIVLAKIISNSQTEVRYKRVDNPDGPIYSVNKQSSTQIIKYPNALKIILNK